MPYIKKEDKDRIGILDRFTYVKNPGELNFQLTRICQEYFKFNGGRYQQINDIIGALECCKLEFYRRLVGPYEDTKIKENGDVY